MKYIKTYNELNENKKTYKPKKLYKKDGKPTKYGKIWLDNIYNNVKFSDDFFKNEEDIIKYRKKYYIESLEKFINFYEKYNPKGFRIINGSDIYEECKYIYDEIINGNLYVDVALSDPDNPLRNILLLLHIDEPGLIRKMNTK